MNLRTCLLCGCVFNPRVKIECCGMSIKYKVEMERKLGGLKNRYEINGEETIIYLKHKGRVVETLIETADLKKLIDIDLKWSVWTSKKTNGKLYVKANTKTVDGKKSAIYLHKIICIAPDGLQVDHINRNPLDNRRSNLRAVTQQVNLLNREMSSSGHEGVSLDKKAGKWKAYLYIEGKQKQIGRFADREEARNAVIAAKEKLIS